MSVVGIIFVVYRSRESLSHLKSIFQFLLSIRSYFKESIILKNNLTLNIIMLQKNKK